MRAFAEALEPFGPADKLPSQAPGPRGRLGELLIAGGFLTEQSLKRALDEQRTSGKLLGRVLLDMGLVAHADLLAAVAMQQGIEVSHPTRRAQAGLGGPTAPVAAGGQVQSRPSRSARAAVLVWVAVGLALAGAFGVGSAYWSSSHGANSSAAPR
jgi:hypothetical protein